MNSPFYFYGFWFLFGWFIADLVAWL